MSIKELLGFKEFPKPLATYDKAFKQLLKAGFSEEEVEYMLEGGK